MDRPKHRWFVFLGLTLLACGVVLLGRQWAPPRPDPGAAPASAITRQLVVPQPDRADVPTANAAAPRTGSASPAPATATSVFRGRLVDAVTRRPIPQQFEVSLVRIQRGPEYREEEPITQTFQSDTGRFAWKNVPAGTWNVTVAAHAHQLFQIESFSIVAGKATREIVMPLRSGYAVRGRVFDRRSGAGVEGATIYASRADASSDEGWNAKGKSKQDGAFELDGVAGGDARLSVNAKEYVHRAIEIFVDDSTPPQEIALATGGRISGLVVTAAGTRVTGLLMLTGAALYADKLNEAGEFSVEHLLAGHYDLAAITPAGSAKLPIELAEDERREGIVLTLGEGRRVRGTIRGLRPEELKDAVVSLRATGKDALSFNAWPDDQGTYTINGVPPGRAMLSIYAASTRRLFRRLDVPVDKDLTFDVVFPQGARMSGLVTRAGEPVTGMEVWLSPFSEQGAWYAARTSAEGRYSFDSVVPGDYRVHVEEDVSRNLTISSDTVFNIDVPLAQLTGLVVEDGSAVPIIGASVHVIGTEPETSSVRGRKSTDHFGKFDLTGLEPGDVLLSVFKPGYELYRERIVYASPIKDKTVQLRKSVGVEVRAHRASEPLRSITVVETVAGSQREIELQIPLDRDGVGSLPSALAGSSLQIYGGTPKSIDIREWDGQPLDVKF